LLEKNSPRTEDDNPSGPGECKGPKAGHTKEMILKMTDRESTFIRVKGESGKSVRNYLPPRQTKNEASCKKRVKAQGEGWVLGVAEGVERFFRKPKGQKFAKGIKEKCWMCCKIKRKERYYGGHLWE